MHAYASGPFCFIPADDWEYEHEKLAADNAGADLLNGSYQAGLVQGLCERHSPQSREVHTVHL